MEYDICERFYFIPQTALSNDHLPNVTTVVTNKCWFTFGGNFFDYIHLWLPQDEKISR